MPTRRRKAETKKKPHQQAAILSEISVLEHQLKLDQQATERAARKVEADFTREAARLRRLRDSHLRKAALTGGEGIRLETRRSLAHDRLAKAHARSGAATRRRLAVLESRLNAL